MAYRFLGSLFAAALLAACAQTEAPEPSGDMSAGAPPPSMPETGAMMDEKASMERTLAGEADMAKPAMDESAMAKPAMEPPMAEPPMTEQPMAEPPMTEQPMAGQSAGMPGSYTVLFDFNSAILTAEAESVIDRAAEAAATQGAGAISITGYADAAGNRGQNETMSRWRAQAVADELVFRGIPPTALDVTWMGAAGTSSDRDQSSRRVEIAIR